jgi:iron complex outermembrane recepter protein
MYKLVSYLIYFIVFLAFSNVYCQQRDTTRINNGQLDTSKISFDKKQLKEVIVTGQKTKLIEYQLNKTVINANALASSAGGNVIDLLNISPGVLVNENGSISLKGREGTIVYIDDKPTYLAGTDLLNYLRSLPISMVDKIELMPNPSSRYNADGTAIINIRLKKISSRGFNGTINLGAAYTRYFKSNNSLLLNYRINNFNFYFNSSLTVSNTFFNSHRERVYNYPNNALSYTLLQDVGEISQSHNSNFNLGIDYNLNKNTTVGVLINRFAETYSEKGKYNNEFLANSGKLDSSIESVSRYTYKTLRNAANLNIKQFFNRPRRELAINLDYLHYANDGQQRLESNIFLQPDSLASEFVLNTENPYDAVIYSAKANYNDTLFHIIKFEQGIQTIYSERNNTSNNLNQSGNPDPQLNNRFRYRENIHAAFITLQRDIRRWSAQAGFRIENTTGNALQYAMVFKPDTSFSIHYINLFPTAFLLYKLDSNGRNTLTFSAARRIERPGYGDLNPSSFYFDRNTVNSGNSLLQPAFSTNMELTYIYNNKLSAGIIYSKTRALLTRGAKQVNDAFITLPVNVDLFTTLGTSISWHCNITRWWTLSIDQQIINRHYKGEIFKTGLYANEHLTTFYLKTYSQFKFKNGWSADLTTTYRSKLPTWQTYHRSIGQILAGIQKKINDKATITIAGNDIFHTYKTRKVTNIQYAQVYYYLVFDTQQIRVTFSYRFGKAFRSRERKTGIEAEAGRL